MDTPAPARLTPAEGRRFAWTLALGFAALGALLLWRDRETPGRIALAIASIAAAAGALLPTRLGGASRAWTTLGVALSRVTSPAFFGLLYVLVLAPMGFVRRRLSRSPLARDPRARTYWVPRPSRAAAEQRESLEHQF